VQGGDDERDDEGDDPGGEPDLDDRSIGTCNGSICPALVGSALVGPAVAGGTSGVVSSVTLPA